MKWGWRAVFALGARGQRQHAAGPAARQSGACHGDGHGFWDPGLGALAGWCSAQACWVLRVDPLSTDAEGEAIKGGERSERLEAWDHLTSHTQPPYSAPSSPPPAPPLPLILLLERK